MARDSINADSSAAQPDIESREEHLRSRILNVMSAIAVLTALYFGIVDTLHGRTFNSFLSFAIVIVFGVIMLVQSAVPQAARALQCTFTGLVGIGFWVLIATQFPDPAIVFWAFPFPLVATFLLGQRAGGAAVVVYNLGIVAIFLLRLYVPGIAYTYDYAIRYCGAMIATSIMAYHYELLRTRSFNRIRALNQSLETRVRERTQALEQSQARLRQAEKLEAIGRLASGITHDFNNQLTAIAAFADSLRMAGGNPTEMHECAEGILTCVRRSSELTRQLLSFARKQPASTAPLDIHAIVRSVTALLARTIDKRITIKEHLAAERSTILGDATQLESALLNIAINARDAIEGAGEITFDTAVVALDDKDCASFGHELPPGDYVRLSISDNGKGMDKKTLERIFEPFFTTKEAGRGTGMGLAAVYGTVRSHNGAITVYSEPGRGTSLHLYLPLIRQETAAPPPASMPVSPAGVNKRHVLVIDDEPKVADSVGKLLRGLGFTVTVYTNGSDALAFFENHWQSVDVVILDLVMPSPGGREIFLALKRMNPDVVVIVSSGYSINGDVRSLLELGAQGFIQKPFTFAELRDRIAEVLQRRT